MIVITKQKIAHDLEKLSISAIARKYNVNRSIISKIKSDKIKSCKVGSKPRLADKFNNSFGRNNPYPVLDIAIAKLQGMVGGSFQCDNIRDYLLDWYYSRPESFFSNKINFSYFLYICFKTEGKRYINRKHRKDVEFPASWF